ncbi:MAG: hypothetical protein AAF845_02200 [Bacteroidota bacterium]
MHPDPSTPDAHRYRSADSETPPEQEQNATPTMDTDRDAAPAATEVDDGARVAEAGHAYVGRMMSDDLKSHPRLLDGDAAVDDSPAAPEDD